MGYYIVQLVVALIALTTTTSIKTFHHDKPETVTISTIKTTSPHSTFVTFQPSNVTLNPIERQKRLLPYENFYLKQNFNKPLALVEQTGHFGGHSSHHQQFKDLVEGRVKKKHHHHRGHVDGLRSNAKFTPFLESNALPGPFRPMIPQPRPVIPVKVEYVALNPSPTPQEQGKQEKGQSPDFSAIYDTLSQLKLRQQDLKQPSYNYHIGAGQRFNQNQARQNPKHQSENNYEHQDISIYKTIQPSKTYIETFTATNIDITGPAAPQREYFPPPQQEERYISHQSAPKKVPHPKSANRHRPTKYYAAQPYNVEVPKSGYLVEYQQTPRKLQHTKEQIRENPYLYVESKPENVEKSQVILVRKPKPVAVIEENNFVAEKYVPYLPLKLSPQTYAYQKPQYEHQQEDNFYEARYHSASPKYRLKGTQKHPQSYQTIVEEVLEETPPQTYLVRPNNKDPKDTYQVATPHPQYEVVSSLPPQKYQQGPQKYMVVEINPELQSYKMVSPKPQLIEFATEEPTAPKYHFHQTVTPAPELQETNEEHADSYDAHNIDEVSNRYPTIEHKPDEEKDLQSYQPVKTIQNQYQSLQVPKYQIVEEPKYEIETPSADKQIEPPKYHIFDDHAEVPKYNAGEPAPDNKLADILKHLQETNALPQTLTPDNIDYSIKTLVRILDALKTRQQQNKPVIYHTDYHDDLDNEAGVDLGGPDSDLDTPDGGTPGRPGVDYPALSSIPQTTFSCKTQRYKGFFGDPDTHCQVWHYCDLNGGQASFLCPNGTIFSQVALTCDWWFNVKCDSTAQLYVLNERLYKYIIPLAPKFPEDYSGPLVDKYLAIKYQEMEEKLKKQKKGKGNKDSDEENNIESEEKDKESDEKEEDNEKENATTLETVAEVEEQTTLREEKK